MFYLYGIRSSITNRIYIGHTKNLTERLKYHNAGYVKSTSREKPWELVACQEFESRSEARWVERLLKNSQGTRTKWIRENSVS